MEIYLKAKKWLKEKLRLRGLDVPELDTAEGKAARRFVEELIGESVAVTITTTKPDKWDRYLSDVFLETKSGHELFLNNLLLENGHAMRKDKFTLREIGLLLHPCDQCNPWLFGCGFAALRGYEFCQRGALEALRSQLQNGRKGAHLKDLLVCSPADGLTGDARRERLEFNLRLCESSTGAKHLHWGPPRTPECM